MGLEGLEFGLFVLLVNGLVQELDALDVGNTAVGVDDDAVVEVELRESGNDNSKGSVCMNKWSLAKYFEWIEWEINLNKANKSKEEAEVVVKDLKNDNIYRIDDKNK